MLTTHMSRGLLMVAGLALLMAVVLGLNVPVTDTAAAPEGGGSGRAADPSRASEPPGVLALQLIRALNGHDVDTFVALFDPYASIQSDRYASRTDDIRTWSRMQSTELERMEVDWDTFRVDRDRAQWTAIVHRSDWATRGIDSAEMFNDIWTKGDHITRYNASLVDGALVVKLGDLWQPRSAPNLTNVQATARPTNATPLVLVALGVSLAVTSTLVRRARGSNDEPRRTASPWAIRELGDWHRAGRPEVTADAPVQVAD